MKKILFITPTSELYAGGEISNFELIKDAVARGYHVEVVVPAKGSLSTELGNKDIPCHIFPYTWWWPASTNGSDHFNSFNAVERIAILTKKQQFDCIITNTSNIPWGALAAAIANIPHAWVLRENPVQEFSYLVDCYKFIDQFSDIIFANSTGLSKNLQANFGLKNVRVVRSFVDASTLQLSEKTGEPRIVQIGRIQDPKNQLELLRALPVGSKIPVLFIGDYDVNGAYYKSLQAEIVKRKLSNVSFLGRKKNAYSFVRKTDIIVQPSKAESVGRVIVESMKLGLLCIGADIPGTKEAISLGGGLLYAHGDPKSLAVVLAKVLENPQEFDVVRSKAQTAARKHFSLNACHTDFFEELENMMKQPSGNKNHAWVQPLHQFINGAASTARKHQTDAIKYKALFEEERLHHDQALKKLELVESSRVWKLVRKLDRIRGRH